MKALDYIILHEESDVNIDDLWLSIELFRIDIVELLDDSELVKIHPLIRDIINSDSYYKQSRSENWTQLLRMEVPN